MEDAARADILIDMDTSSYSAYDLKNIETLFFIGYNTAVKVLEENGYRRVMPQQKLEIMRKEKPHTKIDDIKERAQQMLAKSEELKESARKLITGSKA